jgi:hypothetical protein
MMLSNNMESTFGLKKSMLLIFGVVFTLTASARTSEPPVDFWGRPILDANGGPLNYESAPESPLVSSAQGAMASPLALSAAPASAAQANSALPKPGASPVWRYSLFGYGIGSKGLFLSGTGTGTEIVASSIGGSGDFWQALKYNASTGNYDQAYCSDVVPGTLVRLASGDMAGNGKPQIVLALSNGVIQFLDAATKQQVKTIQTSSGLSAICLADLDGDGRSEIVTAAGGRIYVYSAEGASLWQTASITTNSISEMVVGQMDNDAQLEIAVNTGQVIDCATHAVQWNKTAGFGAHLELADVDNDGKMELITADSWYNAYCFDVDTQVQKWTIRTSLDINAIKVAQISAGSPAVLLLGDGQWGSIHIFDLATGKESFSVSNPNHGVTRIAAGDVTGAGDFKLLWGSGASSSGADNLYVANPFTKAIEWQSTDLTGPFLPPCVGDLDGDGQPELVTCSTESNAGYDSGRILVFDAATLQLRAMSKPVCSDFAWTGVHDLRLRDIDGDGKMEILIGADYLYDGDVEVYGFDASNQFTLKFTNTVRPSGAPFYTVDTVIVNGKPQVVAGNSAAHTGSGGNFLRMYDYATGALSWTSPSFQGTFWNGISSMVLGDWNGDGVQEIAAWAPTPAINFYNASSPQLTQSLAGSYPALASSGTVLVAGGSTGSVAEFSYSGGLYVSSTTWRPVTSGIDKISAGPFPGTWWISSVNELGLWRQDGSASLWTTGSTGTWLRTNEAVWRSGTDYRVAASTPYSLAVYQFPPLVNLDLPAVSVSVSTPSVTEGDSASATFTRSEPTSSPLTVHFQLGTLSGTSSRISLGAQSVTIPAGQTQASVLLGTSDDDLVEPTETVTLSLLPSVNYEVAFPESATFYLADNEPSISLSVLTPSVTEGQAGVLRFNRTGNPADRISIAFTLDSARSTAESHVLLGAHLIQIPAGVSQVDVSVPTLDNSVLEPSETITAAMVGSPHYSLGANQSGTFEVLDNEPTVNLKLLTPAIFEGQPACIELSRTGDTAAPITVYYLVESSVSGSASRLHLGQCSTIIPAGSSQVNASIPSTDNFVVEPTETATVSLVASPSYGSGPFRSGTFKILDNEPTVSFSVLTPAVVEGGTAQIQFSRTGDVSYPLTISYQLFSSRIWGNSRIATPQGTLTIPGGYSEASLRLPLASDQPINGTETITLKVVPSVHYVSFSGETGSFTISDVPSALKSVSVKALPPAISSGQLAQVEFTREGDLTAALTVVYQLTGSPARPRSHLDLGIYTLSFPPGESKAVATFPTRDDVRPRFTEIANVALKESNQFSVTGPPAVFTVTDLVPLVSVSFNPVVVGSLTPPQKEARFTIARSGDLAGRLRVKYTLSGEALRGVDYQAPGNFAVIPAGAASCEVVITAINRQVSPGKSLVLTLDPTPSYELQSSASAAEGVVYDAAPVVSMSVNQKGQVVLARDRYLGRSLAVSCVIAGKTRIIHFKPKVAQVVVAVPPGETVALVPSSKYHTQP